MKHSYNHFLKTRDGERIFYSTNFHPGKAKDPVLVFNYGLVCSNFHWKDQISFFEDLGFSIITHDYRGHFQSSGRNKLEKITFKNISEDVFEILQEMKVDKCIMIGHSMGVNVTLEFARNHQEMLKKMIIISGTLFPVHNIMMNTHLTGPLNPLMDFTLKKYPKPLQAFWKYGGWNPLVKKIIHNGGFNKKRVGNDFIETYLNKLGELGPDLFLQLINQMQEHDLLAFVDKITTPTLIMGGNRDKVIPNYQQRLTAEKLRNNEVYISHEGSHVPQVDYPEMFNERMFTFIRK